MNEIPLTLEQVNTIAGIALNLMDACPGWAEEYERETGLSPWEDTA